MLREVTFMSKEEIEYGQNLGSFVFEHGILLSDRDLLPSSTQEREGIAGKNETPRPHEL